MDKIQKSEAIKIEQYIKAIKNHSIECVTKGTLRVNVIYNFHCLNPICGDYWKSDLKEASISGCIACLSKKEFIEQGYGVTHEFKELVRENFYDIDKYISNNNIYDDRWEVSSYLEDYGHSEILHLGSEEYSDYDCIFRCSKIYCGRCWKNEIVRISKYGYLFHESDREINNRRKQIKLQ